MNEKQPSDDRQLPNNKNQTFTQQQFFTDREASAYLRISQMTLWRERRSRRISFHRLGGKIIYTAADLEEYLANTKQEARAFA